MNLFSTPEPVASQRWVVAPGCVVEPAGGEFVVLCAASSVVYRMTGLAAEVVGRVRLSPGELPGYLAGAVGELAAVGVIVPAGGPMSASGPMAASVGMGTGGRGLSRRGALRLGGAAAAVGVVVLALPSAAAASSSPVGPQVSVTGAVKTTYAYFDEDDSLVQHDEYLFTSPGFVGSFEFTADPPLRMYIAIVGGGGRGGGLFGGGGGGGGVEVLSSLFPDVDVSYRIVVGAAGDGGDALGNVVGLGGGNSEVVEVFGGIEDASWTAFGGSGGSYNGGSGGDSGNSSGGGTGSSDIGERAGGGGAGDSGFGDSSSSGTGGDGGLGTTVRVAGVENRPVAGGGGGGGESGGGGTSGGLLGGTGGSTAIPPVDGQWGSGGGGGGSGDVESGFTPGAAGGGGFVVISFPTGVA